MRSSRRAPSKCVHSRSQQPYPADEQQTRDLPIIRPPEKADPSDRDEIENPIHLSPSGIQEFVMILRFSSLAFLAALGLALWTPQTVLAQDKADSGFRQAMVEFLTIQDAAQTIENQMTYALAQQQLGSIAASGVEITEPIQEIVVDVARTSVGSRFGDVQFLAELYMPLYSKHYSESELRELTAFWQSPIGKKTIAAMPELTEGSSRVLQEASVAFVPEFQTAVNKRLEEAGIVPSAP